MDKKQVFTREEVEDILTRIINEGNDALYEARTIAETELEMDLTKITKLEEEEEPSDDDLKSELNWETEDDSIDEDDDRLGIL